MNSKYAKTSYTSDICRPNVSILFESNVEKMQETEAFITIKDHKEGFPHSLSFRLINPSKADIGKISKCILDSINKTSYRNPKLINGTIHQKSLVGSKT